MRWSAPPSEIASHVVVRHAVAFAVDDRPLVRRRRIHFLLQPLDDVTVLGEGRDVLGADRDRWLVWQSLTGTGCQTRLPTDGGSVARALGLDEQQHAAACLALRELMGAIYETGAG